MRMVIQIAAASSSVSLTWGTIRTQRSCNSGESRIIQTPRSVNSDHDTATAHR